jgi:predicted glycosyltransferase
MKIVVYCQHVLGVGHLFRALEICKALSDHEVILVTGGPRTDKQLPEHVRQLRLPQLQMNHKFKGLFSSRQNSTLAQVKADRQKRLFDLFIKEKPDLFIIELYPFGRKAFRFELDPVIRAIRDKKLCSCGIISSVRDILVEKENQKKHEGRAVEILNNYFDAVLVHSDPKLIKINETFLRFDEITIPVVYTGFIAQIPAPNARQRIRNQLALREADVLVVASAGGGSVGAPLLESVVKAFQQLDTASAKFLHIYTGPYMPENDFAYLKSQTSQSVRVEEFSADFMSYLSAADLSISMAGYNTSMNILAAGTPALVWPFSQNREQQMRANRLAGTGALKVLSDADLSPERLANIIAQTLSQKSRAAVDVNLNGAAHTARWLERWVQKTPSG